MVINLFGLLYLLFRDIQFFCKELRRIRFIFKQLLIGVATFLVVRNDLSLEAALSSGTWGRRQLLFCILFSSLTRVFSGGKLVYFND